MMTSEVTAASIAVAGVLISALVAFVVGRAQYRASLEQSRIETRTVFLGKLYDARLKVYPVLYELLGVLGGKIAMEVATLDDVRQTWDGIRAWDQQNALFLSPFGVQTAIRLRAKFLDLLKLSPEQFSKQKQRGELRPLLIELQMCLKTELGVLHADSFHSPAKLETLREAMHRSADS